MSLARPISTLVAGQEDARILRMKAKAAEDQAGRDEEAQRRSGRQAIGKQAAAFAESGGGIDEGVLRQSSVAAELDALNIRYKGRLQARGFRATAQSIVKKSRFLAGSQLLSDMQKSG